MGLPSQRSDDDGALVDEITRSIDGADDPKKVRSLLNAWWRYAGVRAAAGAEVDAEKFLAERSSLALLELPLPTARGVIELEFAIANGPQGALPVVPSVDQSRVVDRPVAIVPLPVPAPEPAVEPEPEPLPEPEPVAEIVPAPVDEAEIGAEAEVEAEVETEAELDDVEGGFEDAFEGEFEGAFEGEFEYLPEPGTEEPEPAAPIAPLGAITPDEEAAEEQAVAEVVADEPVAELEDEPAAESELDGDPEDEDDASPDQEVEDDAGHQVDEDEPVASVAPVLAVVAEPEPELEAADDESEPEPEHVAEAEPEPAFVAPAAAAVLQPAPHPELDADDEPEADAAPEPATPIPVLALLADHDLVDAPEQWDALDEPVPISHFERFRRDRADRKENSAERAKLSVYAGLVVFFALAVGSAMALSLVITHVSLPGSDAVAIVAPWRAWLAIVTGIAGVVVATVLARRHGLGQVLVGPRIGLGGLAVTGIGLLAGSLIAAGAGGLVLLGGAALGAVRRA